MTSINEALLTDLAFVEDLSVTASGDFDVMSGLVNLRQAVLRRIMTKPGTVLHRPQYGVGLVEFQGAPMTLDVQRQLAKRITEQLPRDPRVEKVLSLSLSSEDYTADKLSISVTVEAIGLGAVEFEYTPFAEVSV